MTNIATPDSSLHHLYPPFAALVTAVIAEADRECAGKFAEFVRWSPFETYRSAARQEWLYAQGRTRPGPIVTYKRGATGLHPVGLACDLVWLDAHGSPHWDGPDALWQTLGHCVRAQGLAWGGDFPTLKDLPHIQPTPAQQRAWLTAARDHLHSLGRT